MEWLVDDFLVDPTSPFLQREPPKKTLKNAERTVTTASKNTKEFGQDHSLEEEELLVESVHIPVPVSATVTSAPGRLKRKNTPNLEQKHYDQEQRPPAQIQLTRSFNSQSETRIRKSSGKRMGPGRLNRKVLSDSSDSDCGEEVEVEQQIEATEPPVSPRRLMYMESSSSNVANTILALSLSPPAIASSNLVNCDNRHYSKNDNNIPITLTKTDVQQRQLMSTLTGNNDSLMNGILHQRLATVQERRTVSNGHKVDPPAISLTTSDDSTELPQHSRRSFSLTKSRNALSKTSSGLINGGGAVVARDILANEGQRSQQSAPSVEPSQAITVTSRDEYKPEPSEGGKASTVPVLPPPILSESDESSDNPMEHPVDPIDQLAADYIRQMMSVPSDTSGVPLLPVNQNSSESLALLNVHPNVDNRSIYNHKSLAVNDINLPILTQETTPSNGRQVSGESTPQRSNSRREASGDSASACSDKLETVSLTASIPRQVELRSSENEFELGHVLPTWKSGSVRFERSMNKSGVFHVRLLRAQRLSCSVGSKVQGIVALKPWKGKVRTSKTVAFSDQKYGVCAKWDEDEVPVLVCHAYTSEESPVPSIHVDVVCNPLGVFDFTLASVTVDCHELLCQPLSPKTQWFSPKGADDGHTEMVQIEAMFDPTGRDDTDDESTPSTKHSVVDELPSTAIWTHVGGHGAKPDDTSQSDVSISFQSLSRADSRMIAAVPHLLRAYSHWKPATCSVCKRSIMAGIRKGGAYRCETCGIDCCVDCQLQVDVKVPCGSDTASKARMDAIQNKLTVSNLLNTVAPTGDDSTDSLPSESLHSKNSFSLDPTRMGGQQKGSDEKARSIGSMKLLFLRACVLSESLSPHAEYSGLIDQKNIAVKKGDYYVRVSSTDTTQTRRTRTVQCSGRPKFDSNEIVFPVPHYGTEFLVELVDATTDKPVGATLITTQCMLQMQRDALAEESIFSYLFLMKGRKKLHKGLRLSLALREGIKKGFGYDFFVESKTQSSTVGPGAVSGIIELRASMVEDMSALFGTDPYECPQRPPYHLDLALFQIHVARIANLVKDVKVAMEHYQYVVSWKNPLLTGVSMIMFLYFWSTFDLAYIGSLPFACLSFLMLYFAITRQRGRLKDSVLRKTIDGYTKSVDTPVEYTLHRPAGILYLNVIEGKNLRSELGLPGKVGIRAYWDPARYMKDETKKKLGQIDRATLSCHDIGTTDIQFSTKPQWSRLDESSLAKRINFLLPHQSNDAFYLDEAEFVESKFPILQPFNRIQGDLLVLEPWRKSCGAVVFEVRFVDTVSLLPGSYSLGEVVIPFSRVVERGEVCGWFQVRDTSRNWSSINEVSLDNVLNDAEQVIDTPQVFLKLKWMGPQNNPEDATETEREASIVIEEELIRSALINQDSKAGLVESSMGAINSVIGIGDQLLLVQNTLGTVLDIIGAVRSAIDFADPFKSGFLFCIVFVAWIFFKLVPTRIMIVLVGLAQYAITFHKRFAQIFGRQQDKDSQFSQDDENTGGTHPYATWIMNSFLGLPTDEDIRKTYFWECRQKRSRIISSRATEKRILRLKRLWRAQWYSQVLMLRAKDDVTVERVKVFALVQGHRFLWWSSAEEFDDGEKALGRILLSGHAGLTTPSPIEMRFFDKGEFARMVGIFGRGLDKQEKVIIITPSEKIKEGLEVAIQFATTSKRD
jgi:hypothetical protein